MHLAGLAAMPARPAALTFGWRDLKPQMHADEHREKELNFRERRGCSRSTNRQARQGRQGD